MFAGKALTSNPMAGAGLPLRYGSRQGITDQPLD